MPSMFSGAWTPPNYTSLITSEHADKPNFMAMIALTTQPFIDQQVALQSMPALFDLDEAVGQQLDMTGQWIGQSRELEVPLTDVYFSFDTVGLGFDEGVWLGPFDPTTELDVLPDDIYRTLLYAKVGNNKWDSTIPDAYSFMAGLFPGSTFFIIDNQDMTMYLGLINSGTISAAAYALFTGNYLDVVPMGVGLLGYIEPSVAGAPVFGFDAENSTISGFDVGAWATITQGS